MTRFAWIVVVCALAFVLVISLTRRSESPVAEPPVVEEIEGAVTPATVTFELALGLRDQPLVIPPDNPMSPEKIALGERLFFDTRLSGANEMSCETCHVPEKGWADGLALSPKYDGTLNTRHTPSLYGAGFYPELYWDGRAQGLEAQVLAAWRGQMGGDTLAIAHAIAGIDGYRRAFEEAFGGPPSEARIVDALATFVRTIHAGDTPWDRHPKDDASLAASEVGQGFQVFSQVAQCTLCHLPPLFADTLFHNVGIGMNAETPDPGRAAYLAAQAEQAGEPLSGEAEQLMGAFKTPTLRGALHHPPYFHDGHAQTLKDAVDLTIAGGVANAYLDEKLQPRTLTPEQRRQLLAFLEALSPEITPYPRPQLPQ